MLGSERWQRIHLEPMIAAEGPLRAATGAFRDGIRASDWLARPNLALGGREPFFMAKESHVGCVLVCNLLNGMAYARDMG